MKCGSRIQLRIDPDVNTNKGIIALVPQPKGEEPAVVPLLDFAKHTAYRSPHGNIITLLENVGESVEDIIGGNTKLYLVEGMKYIGGVDTGIARLISVEMIYQDTILLKLILSTRIPKLIDRFLVSNLLKLFRFWK